MAGPDTTPHPFAAARRFDRGDTVVRREILLGEVWFAMPTICVDDTDDLLARC